MHRARHINIARTHQRKLPQLRLLNPWLALTVLLLAFAVSGTSLM